MYPTGEVKVTQREDGGWEAVEIWKDTSIKFLALVPPDVTSDDIVRFRDTVSLMDLSPSQIITNINQDTVRKWLEG